MKKFLFIVLMVVMAVSGGLFARDILIEMRSAKIAEEVRAEHEAAKESLSATTVETMPVVEETEAVEETMVESETAAEETTAEPVPHTRRQEMWVNFATSGSKSLEYPVMVDNVDDYYFLKHSSKEDGTVDPDGVKNYVADKAGAIYCRTVDFDNHEGDVVIFGHSMRNGSMLKDVRKFDKSGDMYDVKLVQEYEEGKKHILMDVDGKELKLTPFACYHGEADNSYMAKHEGADLQRFVLEKTGKEVEADTVYIFITCSYNESDNERTYLFCRPV